MGDNDRLKSKAVSLRVKLVYGANTTLQSDPDSMHVHINTYTAFGLKFLSFYRRSRQSLNKNFNTLVQQVFN